MIVLRPLAMDRQDRGRPGSRPRRRPIADAGRCPPGPRRRRPDHRARAARARSPASPARTPTPQRSPRRCRRSGKRIRVAVEWDEHQLASTFRAGRGAGRELDGAARAARRCAGRLVRLRAARGDVSRLLHLAADERVVGAVFADLVADAAAAGSAVISGRAEPHLEQPLRERLAAVGFAWQPVIRARDPELAAALASGSALLTRLDGELSRFH